MSGSPNPGPVPRILGRAVEPLYRWEINRRNRAYDNGSGVTRLDRAVISIGNLSVGGTGKTPMVRRVLEWLLEAERRPCVAMRGYKATASTESDEADAHRRAFPSVPIVAQPDRIAGLRALFETQIGRDVDTIVLDDGFQHRKLARNTDLVLIDASRNPFQDRLIPAGWLREPAASLARASAVILTHAELVTETARAELIERITQAHGQPPLATTRHGWGELDVLDESGENVRPPEWLLGTRALAVCAIGNPAGFLHAGQRAVGDGSLESIVLRDHDPYLPDTMRRIFDKARDLDSAVIVTTDKDWSKLAAVPADRWPCPVVRPRLRLGFDQGEDALRRMIVETRVAASPEAP